MTWRRPTVATVVAFLTGCVVAAGHPSAASGQTPAGGASVVASHRATLDEYCVGCHNERLTSGEMRLDTLDLADVAAGAESWERVIAKLRSESMPPPGRPRPDQATYRNLAAWLENEIDMKAGERPHPGRPETFHRLNRAEYGNAIRDLLALEVNVAAMLPVDNTYEHGFDNNGDLLSVSPALLARYLSAARKISRQAVGITPAGPTVETYRIHPNFLQDDRASEDLPFGTRGGLAVRHYFPVDGEYVIKIKLHRNFSDYILGFSTPHQIDIRLDGTPVNQFTVGGQAKGSMAPLSFAGNILGSPEWEAYMNGGDAGLEVRFAAKAGPRLVAASFLRKVVEPDGVLQPRQRDYGLFVDEQYDGLAAIEQVSIGGPYRNDGPGDTPSRREIFVCRPEQAAEEDGCAKRIIAKLASRAYRRPVTDADVQVLLGFYEAGRRDGNGFEPGIQFAIERMLVDPDFLYRVERDPAGLAPGTPYGLGDVELASRLSFFLWSSIPDEQLLDLASRGRLKEPAVLEQQVRRMLQDPRSRALVDNFASQWLRLRNLAGQERESAEYPDFDENLREAFRTETELFIESTIQEDRSVVDLLSATYTFVNERLARHYGIPKVYGSHFRRVTLPQGDPRGGLLGHGALLTITSYPNRTSPVLRGKWLLESILGAPPPEPPADVPGLPDRGEGGKPASVRERLELHRRNPVCASCHQAMDPLGFALENFDAIGAWRDVGEAGMPVDASGTMPGGVKFEGPSGLQAVLLGRRDGFAQTVTEKLLAYAVGRGLTHHDRPVIRKITGSAAPQDYRWSSLILGLVKSTAFQMRETRGTQPVAASVN